MENTGGFSVKRVGFEGQGWRRGQCETTCSVFEVCFRTKKTTTIDISKIVSMELIGIFVNCPFHLFQKLQVYACASGGLRPTQTQAGSFMSLA